MRNSWRCAAVRITRPMVALSAALVLVAAPVPCAASSVPVGQLAAKGTAEINGVDAASGATVFANDRVATEAGSVASLSLASDRRVVLLEKSSLRITKDTAMRLTAALEDGRIAVFSPAKSPLVVAAGGTEIVPGKDGGLYAVEVHGDRLTVTVSQGTASVEATNRTIEVGEGKTLEATIEPAQETGGGGTPGVQSRVAAVLVVVAAALFTTTLVLLIRDLNTGCKVVSPSAGTCQVTH